MLLIDRGVIRACVDTSVHRDRPKFREDREPNRGTQSSENDNDGQDSRGNARRFVGKTIAEKYKILELVGQGGMSAVYRAEHIVTQKIVALKLMHSHLLTDNNSIRRFQQEAKAASRLRHPNTISLDDMGVTEDGQLFLTMEFLEGWSLSEVIKADKRLEVERCFHIFKQTCSALAHAHENGIIHRDLKPSNVMLIRSGYDPDFVKVVDFGIARIMPEGGEGLKLTATGEVLGSPLYMSPEQCMGLPLDGRSDIYSMGCLMYEALSGCPPLPGKNMMETMYRQMNDEPDALTDVEGDIRQVKRLDEIIQNCMAKRADDRYQTMDEVEQDLHHAQTVLGGSKIGAMVGLEMTQAGRVLRNKTGPKWKLIFGLICFAAVSVLVGAGGIIQYCGTAGDPDSKQRTLTLNLNFETAADESRLASLEGLNMIGKAMYQQILGKGETDDSTVFYHQMQLGDFYMRLGKFDNALTCYKEAQQSITKTQLDMMAADHAHLLRGQAFCYLGTGKVQEAEKLARKSLELIEKTLQSESSWTKLSTLGLLAEIDHRQSNAKLQTEIPALEETYKRTISRRKGDLEPDYPYAAAIALKQGADAASSLGLAKHADWMYHNSLKEWVHLEGVVGLERVAVDEGVLLNDLGMVAMSQNLYETKSSTLELKEKFDKLNLDSILKGDARNSLNESFDLKLISEPDANGHIVNDNIGAIDYFKMAASRISQTEPVSVHMAMVLFNLADAYREDKKYIDATKTRLEAQKILREFGNGR